MTFARSDGVLSAEKDVELAKLFLFSGIDVDVDLTGSYGGFGEPGRCRRSGDSMGNRGRRCGSGVVFWAC